MKKIAYNQEYFQKRDHLDPKIASAVENFARDHSLSTILDVGCGTGKLVKYLIKHGFKATGCDPYARVEGNIFFIANRENHGRESVDEATFSHTEEAQSPIRYEDEDTTAVRPWSFIKSSATHLPLKNNSIDMITSISVVEHLKKEELAKFLTEAVRVLKDKGYIFLVTPNYNSIWRRLLGKKWFGYSDPTHINFYNPESLADLLVNYGFNNIQFSFNIQNLSFLDYLLVSTPFWRIRDSFYIAAQKI